MNLFTPAEIAENIGNSGVAKGKLPLLKTVLLGIAAGAFIAFGAFAAIIIAAGWPDPWATSGLNKAAMGVVFSVGLILVVLTGAELFTGNNMFLTVSLLTRKTGWGQLLKNWGIVFLANFAGALIVVAIVHYGNFFTDATGALTAAGQKALAIGEAKTSLSFGAALSRAIGCNWLVCLAVWLAGAAKDVTGKIFGCLFPVLVFVMVGFEHSVANMFFIPAAMTVADGAITMKMFLLNNLLPVTLGNIIGGAVFVATLFWGAYLRSSETKPKS